MRYSSLGPECEVKLTTLQLMLDIQMHTLIAIYEKTLTKGSKELLLAKVLTGDSY